MAATRNSRCLARRLAAGSRSDTVRAHSQRFDCLFRTLAGGGHCPGQRRTAKRYGSKIHLSNWQFGLTLTAIPRVMYSQISANTVNYIIALVFYTLPAALIALCYAPQVGIASRSCSRPMRPH